MLECEKTSLCEGVVNLSGVPCVSTVGGEGRKWGTGRIITDGQSQGRRRTSGEGHGKAQTTVSTQSSGVSRASLGAQWALDIWLYWLSGHNGIMPASLIETANQMELGFPNLRFAHGTWKVYKLFM